MLHNMMICNVHPKLQSEAQKRQTAVVQSNLSFCNHNPTRLLSKSEVKKTTSDILLVSTDVFGRSFSDNSLTAVYCCVFVVNIQEETYCIGIKTQ